LIKKYLSQIQGILNSRKIIWGYWVEKDYKAGKVFLLIGGVDKVGLD